MQNTPSVKIVHISDTHDKFHRLINHIPSGDILVFTGDLGTKYKEFKEMIIKLPHQYKILCPGNHDYWKEFKALESLEENIVVLQGSCCEVLGVRIFGHSWCKLNNSNRFLQPLTIKPYIPKDLDILLTHIPPHLIFDLAWDPKNPLTNMKCKYCDKVHKNYYHWGSKGLLEEIKKSKPKFHCFGHVHDDMGKKGKIDEIETVFVNGSSFCVSMQDPLHFQVFPKFEFRTLICTQNKEYELCAEGKEIKMKKNSGQKWVLSRHGQIKNNEGKCLMISKDQQDIYVIDEKDVDLKDKFSKWNYFDDFILPFVNMKIVLDVDAQDSTQVILWNKTGRKNQKFRFI